MVTRANLLAYRAWAQGLDRRPDGLDRVLALGVQDTPHGSARDSLAARGVTDPEAARGAAVPAEVGPLVTVWSWRGAPHWHRRADPPFLAEALWPLSDADAQKRIATTVIKDGAKRGIEAFTEAATVMREVVTRKLPKGEVSTQVSARIPADLTFDCPTCQARHISGALFQLLGLAAGVQVETEGRSTYLSPLPKDARPPAVPTRAAGTADALLRYLEVLGPASPAHLAGFLGTTQAVVKSVLPQGLIEVSGFGLLPEHELDHLRRADPPRFTRLLPPSDPWLQARDRELLVPDEAHRKVVWGAIGKPGVVLTDGEVVATWRAKTQRRTLLVTVEPLAQGTLSRRTRTELEQEAHLLATARTLDSAALTISS